MCEALHVCPNSYSQIHMIQGQSWKIELHPLQLPSLFFSLTNFFLNSLRYGYDGVSQILLSREAELHVHVVTQSTYNL